MRRAAASLGPLDYAATVAPALERWVEVATFAMPGLGEVPLLSDQGLADQLPCS